MYIKRYGLIADLLDYKIKYPHQTELLDAFEGLVRSKPAENVRPAETCHGGLKLGFNEYCSNCNVLAYLGNYCSNCGAKVERGKHRG
jgi:hypothetical protein